MAYGSSLDNIMNFRGDQEAADQEADALRRKARILQAADQFASAGSGGAYKGVDVQSPLLEQAQGIEAKPKQQYQMAQELELDNPTSPTSRGMQDVVRKAFGDINGLDTLSARRLQALHPILQSYAGLKSKQTELATKQTNFEASKAEKINDPTLNEIFGSKEAADEVRRRYSEATTQSALGAIDAQVKGQKDIYTLLGNRQERQGARADAAAARAETAADRAAAREQTAEERKTTRQESATAKAEHEREQRYDRITKDLQPVGKGLAGIESVEAIIKNAGGAVPGAGFLEQHVPTFLLSDQSKDMRQQLQNLKNAYINANAGTAVSASEDERIKAALTGSGTVGEVLNGIKLLKKAFRQTYETRTKSIGQQDPVLKGQLEESIIPVIYRTEFNAVPAPAGARPGRIRYQGKTWTVGPNGTMTEEK